MEITVLTWDFSSTQTPSFVLTYILCAQLISRFIFVSVFSNLAHMPWGWTFYVPWLMLVFLKVLRHHSLPLLLLSLQFLPQTPAKCITDFHSLFNVFPCCLCVTQSSIFIACWTTTYVSYIINCILLCLTWVSLFSIIIIIILLCFLCTISQIDKRRWIPWN